MSTWTYDLSSNNGRVRLKIGDTNIDPTTSAVFTDEELAVFLDMEATINGAAAAALEAVAAGGAKLPLILRSLNFSRNTTLGRSQLLALANRLRETDSGANLYGTAEIAQTDASVVEIIRNNALRGG